MKTTGRSILGISITLVLLLTGLLYAEDTYKNYRLPPVMSVQPDFKPLGNVAWLPIHAQRVFNEADEPANAAAYFPEGNAVVVGQSEGRRGGRIVKWDLINNRKLWEIRPFKPKRGRDYQRITQVEVSPNGRYIFAIPYFRSGDNDYVVLLLDAKTGRTIRRLKKKSFHPNCAGRRNGRSIMLQAWRARFSPDSKSLYVFAKNQYGANYSGCRVVDDTWILKWSLRDRGGPDWKYNIRTDAVPEFKIPERACFTRPNFDVSGDGRWVAIGNCNGQVFVVDASRGREVFQVRSFLGVSKRYNLPGTYRINAVRFDPNDRNKLYASISDAGRRALLARADLSRRDFEPFFITGQTSDIPRLALSPDSRIIAMGYDTLHAWDRKNKYLITAFGGYDFKLNPVFQEMMVLSGHDLIFIQQRKKKTIRLRSGWNDTGLYVARHIAYYIKAKGGKMYVDVNAAPDDNRGRYEYETYFYEGGKAHAGGRLFIKPLRSGMTATVIGGLDGRKEQDFGDIRKRSRPWGRYPAVRDYGGRVGVNNYQANGKLYHGKKPPKKVPIGRKKYDWQKYKVSREKADEELMYGLNTRRPGLMLAAIKAGANVNLRSSIGIPIIALAATGDVDGVYILVSNGADVNAYSSVKVTAMINAAWNKQTKIMRILLDAGAKVNHANKNGHTALMRAAQKCHEMGVSLLLSRGADCKLRAGNGDTALSLMKSSCGWKTTGKKIRKILEKRGCKS